MAEPPKIRVSKRIRALCSPFLFGAQHPKYEMPTPVAKTRPDIEALNAARRVCRAVRAVMPTVDKKTFEIALFEFLRLYAKAYSQKRFTNRREREIQGELSRVIGTELGAPFQKKGKPNGQYNAAHSVLWDEQFKRIELHFLKLFWPEEYALHMRIMRHRAKQNAVKK